MRAIDVGTLGSIAVGFLNISVVILITARVLKVPSSTRDYRWARWTVA
jgi:hypothetical protein